MATWNCHQTSIFLWIMPSLFYIAKIGGHLVVTNIGKLNFCLYIFNVSNFSKFNTYIFCNFQNKFIKIKPKVNYYRNWYKECGGVFCFFFLCKLLLFFCSPTSSAICILRERKQGLVKIGEFSWDTQLLKDDCGIQTWLTSDSRNKHLSETSRGSDDASYREDGRLGVNRCSLSPGGLHSLLVIPDEPGAHFDGLMFAVLGGSIAFSEPIGLRPLRVHVVVFLLQETLPWRNVLSYYKSSLDSRKHNPNTHIWKLKIHVKQTKSL